MTTCTILRVKLSDFLVRYFTDPTSRPAKNTLVNHIKSGKLSGEQLGGAWYVKCTEWGEPLHYGAAPPTTKPKTRTGNKLADSILATLP